MTPSLILRTSAPLLLWLPLMVSIYILLRGHNEPGGGFVGGLMGSAGLFFYAIARGRRAAQRALAVPPVSVAAGGVALAAASGLPGFLVPGADYLHHLWWFPDVGVTLPLGTALVFDVGVYLSVLGMTAAIFFALLAWQEEDPRPAATPSRTPAPEGQRGTPAAAN